MITVKVTYTVNESFISKNKENINAFLKDFKKLDRKDFRYTVYIYANGKTFVHLSEYKDDTIQHTLLNMPSFIKFQEERDKSGLEKEPVIEVMSFLDASHDPFI